MSAVPTSAHLSPHQPAWSPRRAYRRDLQQPDPIPAFLQVALSHPSATVTRAPHRTMEAIKKRGRKYT